MHTIFKNQLIAKVKLLYWEYLDTFKKRYYITSWEATLDSTNLESQQLPTEITNDQIDIVYRSSIGVVCSSSKVVKETITQKCDSQQLWSSSKIGRQHIRIAGNNHKCFAISGSTIGFVILMTASQSIFFHGLLEFCPCTVRTVHVSGRPNVKVNSPTFEVLPIPHFQILFFIKMHNFILNYVFGHTCYSKDEMIQKKLT